MGRHAHPRLSRDSGPPTRVFQEPPTPCRGQDSDSRLERPSKKRSSRGTREGDRGACLGEVTTPRHLCGNSLCYLRKGHKERLPAGPRVLTSRWKFSHHLGPEAPWALSPQTQSLRPGFPCGSGGGGWRGEMGIRTSPIATRSWPQGCEAEYQAVERGCPVWRLRPLAAWPAPSPHCHPRIRDYDGNTHTQYSPPSPRAF